jgi:hypothetical protein
MSIVIAVDTGDSNPGKDTPMSDRRLDALNRVLKRCGLDPVSEESDQPKKAFTPTLTPTFKDAEDVVATAIGDEDANEPLRYGIRWWMTQMVKEYTGFVGPEFFEGFTSMDDDFVAEHTANLPEGATVRQLLARVVVDYAIALEKLIQIKAFPKGSTLRSMRRLAADYANGKWLPSLPPRIPQPNSRSPLAYVADKVGASERKKQEAAS